MSHVLAMKHSSFPLPLFFFFFKVSWDFNFVLSRETYKRGHIVGKHNRSSLVSLFIGPPSTVISLHPCSHSFQSPAISDTPRTSFSQLYSQVEPASNLCLGDHPPPRIWILMSPLFLQLNEYCYLPVVINTLLSQ